MPALKEPAHINLAEGLTLLQESGLSAEEAEARLTQAFIRRAFIRSESPIFALPYDEADIDWATGSVKIPRKKERFWPTFSRFHFNAYFFEDHLEVEKISKEPHNDLIADEKLPELLTQRREGAVADWKGIGEKVVSGVLTAIVIGILALLWNWASQGGMVRVLGGVTQKDLEEIAKRARMPPGAVVAFDLRDGCPEGWNPFGTNVAKATPGAGGNLYTRDGGNFAADADAPASLRFCRKGGE